VVFPRRLFLFDLDGTLIDSRADIVSSVNLALARMRLQALDPATVIRFVGDGVESLMMRALTYATGAQPDDAKLRTAVNLLMEEYGLHLTDSTSLYPGVREAIHQLSWGTFGVISNKPEHLSRRVLEALGMAGSFCIILGGDSLPARKPRPDPLVKAMQSCRAEPHQTVMIGDSPSDIQAGQSAGVLTCGFSGGFRPAQELLAAGCDILISSMAELPGHFRAP
jgi:phosphoglycolate phosphatase